MKQRFGLDAIGHLTDSSIRWSSGPPKKVKRSPEEEAVVARLLGAIEEKQRETEQLMLELRRRVQPSG